MDILIVTEKATDRPKEGLEVFVSALLDFLKDRYAIEMVYSYGKPPAGIESKKILSNKIIISSSLVSNFKKNQYKSIIYIPTSSLTAFGMLRGVFLNKLSKKPVIIIALQERSIGPLHKLIASAKSNIIILTPSRKMLDNISSIGVKTSFLIPGFREEKFYPVTSDKKTELRKKYKLPLNKFLILHVGHARKSRNIESLAKGNNWGNDVQLVFKAGEGEKNIIENLKNSGILVIDEYIEDINEIYQASDCYLFHVTSSTGALELPLSIIEACACNLPVLSTRFGAVEDLFEETDGFYFFNTIEEAMEKLKLLRKNIEKVNTRKFALNFTWSNVFKKYLEPIMEKLIGG